jgi:hypothetical protein
MDFNEQNDREEIYSKPVRAGKRTYFFDVKSTKGDDLYLTVTESKKRFRDDGTFYYEKHKIFLYKEDFEKFSEGLNEAIQFINSTNRTEVRSNGHSTVVLGYPTPYILLKVIYYHYKMSITVFVRRSDSESIEPDPGARMRWLQVSHDLLNVVLESPPIQLTH